MPEKEPGFAGGYVKEYSGDRAMYGSGNGAPPSVCCFCMLLSSAASISICVIKVLV